MSLEAWGDEGNVGPEGYVAKEFYDECNEDRMLFATYLLSALPYLPTGLKEDVEIALMERLSAADRAEAEASSIADPKWLRHMGRMFHRWAKEAASEGERAACCPRTCATTPSGSSAERRLGCPRPAKSDLGF